MPATTTHQCHVLSPTWLLRHHHCLRLLSSTCSQTPQHGTAGHFRCSSTACAGTLHCAWQLAAGRATSGKAATAVVACALGGGPPLQHIVNAVLYLAVCCGACWQRSCGDCIVTCMCLLQPMHAIPAGCCQTVNQHADHANASRSILASLKGRCVLQMVFFHAMTLQVHSHKQLVQHSTTCHMASYPFSKGDHSGDNCSNVRNRQRACVQLQPGDEYEQAMSGGGVTGPAASRPI